MNLLDGIELLLAREGEGDTAVVGVPQHAGPADAILTLRRGDARAATLAARLAGSSPAARAWDVNDHVELRFDDERIVVLGAALEAGAVELLGTRELSAGERWVIDYAAPNATKALHVGHLRNLAIGQCLARIAEAAGIAVKRYSRVSDFGRSVGEAVAGYLRYGADRTPESTGMKGDHLVGECYARYVAEMTTEEQHAQRSEEGADEVLSREQDVRYDLPDELLERWRRGDTEIAGLYERVRDWAIDGQDATLARLGIVMDRNLLESEVLNEGERFVAAAIDRGIVTRGASGATFYETGAEGYPRMLLNRSDGFPTQHLRYVATYLGARPLMLGATSISVLGKEWTNLAKYTIEILSRSDPDGEIHPTVVVTHEMVVGGSGVVKSSKGDAPLIDVLLDTLAACDPVAELCGRCERCDPERVAATVALGYFLGQPVKKRMALSIEDLLDERKSIGLTLARAWARAASPAFDGPADPDAEDEAYRFVVVQSQRHRRLLARSLDNYEAFDLARFHFHFARWFTSLVEPSPRVARAARSVIESGLVTLGLFVPRPLQAEASIGM